MSSSNASSAKRKHSAFNPPRQRATRGRTASLPNPRGNERKPAARTNSTISGRGAAAGRRKIASGHLTATVISSDEDQSLIDDEAEEGTEEDPEDGSEELDHYGEGDSDERLEGNEEDAYGLESPTPGATVISSSPEPEYMLAELVEEPDEREQIESSDPQIPPKLLTRLLHHHFQNDKTKIAKDANMVVAKYIDVFIREAIARSAHERRESLGDDLNGVDNFLEVSLTSVFGHACH